MADFKLKYIIDADGSKAKSEIENVDGRLTKLGGASSSAAAGLTSLINPAALAATAVAAVATAAVATAIKLFDLSRSAAEFGSEIYDASQKTGLGTESLSALKIAAEQSGNSFEGVTGSIAKFNVLIGEANEGNEKARATLEKYGITATDTQGALEQAVKAIADMESADRQAAAAKALFRDRTAEILPVIKSFDGDLPGLIKRLREMGLLLSEENAVAADLFADQMDMLSEQLADVGRTLGFSVMPIFIKWATYVSEWLAKNEGQITAWANRFAKSLEFVAASIINNIDAFAGLAEIIVAITTYDWNRAASGIQRIGAAISAQRDAWNTLTTNQKAGRALEAGRKVKDVVVLPSDDPESKSKAASRKTKGDDTADADERKRIAGIKENIQIEIDEKKAAVATLIQLDKQRYAEGILSEEEYVRAIREHEIGLLSFIIDAKERERDAIGDTAEDYRRLNSDIKILNAEREQTLSEFDTQDAERRKKKAEEEEADHEKRKKRWNEMIDKMKEASDAQDALDAKRGRETYEAGMATAEGTLYGSIADSLGADLVPMFDAVTNAMLSFQERLALVTQDINSFVGGAIGNMINGLAQMGIAWLTTGKFSAKAALQMLASVAMSIAAQAAIKGVFEAAEAVAAAARWDFVSASLHSAAASMYATVAVIAGAAGVGLALASRAFGGGQAAGQSFSNATSGAAGANDAENAQNQPLVFTERFNGFLRQQTDRIAEQIERQNVVLGGVMEVVGELGGKVRAMSPGHVLGIGAEENPTAVRTALETELGSDLRASTNFFRQTGQYK